MAQTPAIKFLRDRYGQSVAFATHGRGPLVICPAWWVSHVQKDWDQAEFRTFFEQLGDGFTVVRYDRPGVGLSDRNVKPRSFEDEVDLLDDVAAELGEPSYALFAISCAGPIAIHHARRHPKRVQRIVFCGSFLNGPDICSREVQEAVQGVVRAHWGLGSRALADIFFPDADTAQLDMFAKQTRASSSAKVAEDLLALTYAMTASDQAHKVTTPCLIIHRQGDRAIPFDNGRALAATLPNAELVTLEGRTHIPWFDGAVIAHTANAYFRDIRAPKTVISAAKQPSQPANNRIQFDEPGKCLIIDGAETPLTPIEFRVLKLLTEQTPHVVSRDTLLESVWKQPYDGSNRVDVAMSALRRKLGSWSASIETVTGHGYRFRAWQKK